MTIVLWCPILCFMNLYIRKFLPLYRIGEVRPYEWNFSIESVSSSLTLVLNWKRTLFIWTRSSSTRSRILPNTRFVTTSNNFRRSYSGLFFLLRNNIKFTNSLPLDSPFSFFSQIKCLSGSQTFEFQTTSIRYQIKVDVINRRKIRCTYLCGRSVRSRTRIACSVPFVLSYSRFVTTMTLRLFAWK